MNRDARHFLFALFLLVAIGATLLYQPLFSQTSDRDAQYFLARKAAEAVFDACSAVCGSGLLAGPLDARYTEAGRWTLWAVGLAGALAYLAFATRVVLSLDSQGREPGEAAIGTPQGVGKHPISIVGIIVGAIVCFAALTVAVFAAGRLACPTVTLGETAWLTGCAFFSVGLTPGAVDPGTAWMLAAVALMGSLGWPVWLLFRARVRRHSFARAVRRSALVYIFVLAGLSAVFCAMESPRSGEAVGKLSERSDVSTVPLSQEPIGPRFARCTAAVIAASSGIATEPLAERSVRDGSRALLAGVMLLGGVAGGFSGGMSISILWLGWRRPTSGWRIAATRLFIGYAVALIIVAIGTILISTAVATRYQATPTFADALLEASCALSGGNLSSGLTGAITGRNLVSGIGLGVSFDFVGMSWLIAAMLFGRVWPLFVLTRIPTARR